MLKFFRKIRQQLLKEGNFRRYILYPIGEILLMMIGILLALQVNKWTNSEIENNKLLANEIIRLIEKELQ